MNFINNMSESLQLNNNTRALLLNRIELAEKQYYNRIKSKSNGNALRQNTLLSNPDSLSDEELLKHRTESRVRCLFKYLTLFGVPAVLFMRYRSYHVLAYSFIASIYLSNCVRNCNWLSRSSDETVESNVKSMDDYYTKVLRFNGIITEINFHSKYTSNIFKHSEYIKKMNYK